MKKIFILLLIISSSCLLMTTSCQKCGCTDSSATNYDENADCTDNSKCTYPPPASHKISFYASTSQYYDGSILCNVTKVQVYVNGTSIGTTAAWYPYGPGNCICPGTVPYTTACNGCSVPWYSNVTLSDGTVLIGSGTVTLDDANNDCTTQDVCP